MNDDILGYGGGTYQGAVSGSRGGRISRRAKMIIVVVVVAIVAVAGAIVVVNLLKKKEDLHGANLKVIFDQTAPIPVMMDGKYGYLSPEDGEMLIGARYVSAERFYGDYAKVVIEDRRGLHYSVINRKGDVVGSSDDESGVEYIIDEDMWRVGEVFYDGVFEQITNSNDSAFYIGFGYMKVVRKNNKDDQRILDKFGKEIYSCGGDCIATVRSSFNGNGEYYAIVQLGGEGRLVDMQTGKIVYTLNEKAKYLGPDGNNVFFIRNNNLDIEKFLFVSGGSVVKEFAGDVRNEIFNGHNVIMVTDNSNSVSYYDVEKNTMLDEPKSEWLDKKVYAFSDYTLIGCESGFVGLRKGKKEVLPCEYDSIKLLPDNVFRYFSEEKGMELFVLEGSHLKIYDVANRVAVIDKDFGDDVQFVDNTPFYTYYSVTGDKVVGSLFTMDDSNVNASSGEVEYSGSWLVNKDGLVGTWYNSLLNQIARVVL